MQLLLLRSASKVLVSTLQLQFSAIARSRDAFEFSFSCFPDFASDSFDEWSHDCIASHFRSGSSHVRISFVVKQCRVLIFSDIHPDSRFITRHKNRYLARLCVENRSGSRHCSSLFRRISTLTPLRALSVVRRPSAILKRANGTETSVRLPYIFATCFVYAAAIFALQTETHKPCPQESYPKEATHVVRPLWENQRTFRRSRNYSNFRFPIGAFSCRIFRKLNFSAWNDLGDLLPLSLPATRICGARRFGFVKVPFKSPTGQTSNELPRLRSWNVDCRSDTGNCPFSACHANFDIASRVMNCTRFFVARIFIVAALPGREWRGRWVSLLTSATICWREKRIFNILRPRD